MTSHDNKKTKKIFSAVLATIIIASGPATNPTPIAHATTIPPIYVSITTHNEQPDSGRYPDFTENESDFWAQRDAVVTFADMLKNEGVKYNWQSAWNFLLAANTFDNGDSATGTQNIVEYLQGLGFSVNIHGHVSTYNYADVAYLIDQLGNAPSGIMGGFIATPASSSELEDLWSTQHGNTYAYAWTPTAAWGASGFGHSGDDDLKISGVWKPQDNDNFLTHNDSAALPVIGTYTSDWDGLTDLLTRQANGELDPTVMHTATIMVDQDELLTSSDRTAIQAKIEALQDETAAGRIIWSTLEDVVATWQTTYNSVPSLYQETTHSYLATTTSHTSTANTATPKTSTSSSSESTTATDGSLIKTACPSTPYGADDPCTAVYYVTADNQRHAFPNSKIFFTWYADFDTVVTVSAAEMSAHQLGENVTYHPGTRMIKFPSVNTVYAVAQGGELRAVKSEDVAVSLYGSAWNTKIDDLSEAFYSNYTFGKTILSSADYSVDGVTSDTTSIEMNFK